MPSGAKHDAITFLLTVPAAAVGYAATGSLVLATAIAGAFLFGGLMFGPDLDTVSRQYSRWGPLRLMWFPYRSFFRHRSRWSHGLIFGTLIRVVYFLGAVTILLFLAAYLAVQVWGGDLPDALAFVQSWRTAGTFVESTFGSGIMPVIFAGMWAGAASHTVTDIAVSYVKTGRVSEFL